MKRTVQAAWMTSSVLKQLHLRDNCLKTARRSSNADDWSNYRVARNKAVAMIRSSKRKFFCNAFEENKGNSRGIWKTIRTLTGSGKNRRDINSINIGEVVIDDKKLMAQHFNAHFSSIADRLISTLPQFPSDLSKLQNFVRSRKSPDTSYVIPSITSAQVLTMLQKLSPCKAAGIDKISSQLLHIAAPVIAPVVVRLINFSFSSGSFPSRWKTAKAFPLCKNGDSRDVQNFRPIPVLPVLSKVIEGHVHDSLYSYLTEKNLIYPRQLGFRKNHSTDTALIQIIDDLLFNLDKKRVSGMVLVDYCKAFNMVDHRLLLDKLKVYGVVGKTMKWFQSYLADRHQLVYLGGSVSDMVLMKHGVPHGSILGPLFFRVFINDLPLHVSSAKIDLYSDDTTITSSADCGSMGRLQESLNTSVSDVFNWALANRLPLNEKKTKVLTVKGK